MKQNDKEQRSLQRSRSKIYNFVEKYRFSFISINRYPPAFHSRSIINGIEWKIKDLLDELSYDKFAFQVLPHYQADKIMLEINDLNAPSKRKNYKGFRKSATIAEFMLDLYYISNHIAKVDNEKLMVSVESIKFILDLCKCWDLAKEKGETDINKILYYVNIE